MHLKEIFVYRQDQLAKLLGGGTVRTVEPTLARAG